MYLPPRTPNVSKKTYIICFKGSVFEIGDSIAVAVKNAQERRVVDADREKVNTRQIDVIQQPETRRHQPWIVADTVQFLSGGDEIGIFEFATAAGKGGQSQVGSKLPGQDWIPATIRFRPDIVGSVRWTDEIPADFHERFGILHLSRCLARAAGAVGHTAGLYIPETVDDLGTIPAHETAHIFAIGDWAAGIALLNDTRAIESDQSARCRISRNGAGGIGVVYPSSDTYPLPVHRLALAVSSHQSTDGFTTRDIAC